MKFIRITLIVFLAAWQAEGLAQVAFLENIHWKDEWLLSGDNKLIGTVNATAPLDVKMKCEKELVSENTWEITWTFTAKRDVPNVRLTASFEHVSKPVWWMIPAVSYNGNHLSRGLEPKGEKRDRQWYTFSYKRTPIPGAIYSEGEDFAIATFGNVPEKPEDDYSCGIQPEPNIITHQLLWPEEEMPVTYCAQDQYAPGWQRVHNMKQGETRKLSMYLIVARKETNHNAYRHMLDMAWLMAEPEKLPEPDGEKLWQQSVEFCHRSLWIENDDYMGYLLGLNLNEKGEWQQITRNCYEAGWLGQNISLAVSVLHDFNKTGDHVDIDQGIATLDTWADNCQLPNGLFITQYDAVIRKSNCIMDACNLGTAAMQFFEADRIVKQLRLVRTAYLGAAWGICNFMLADQQPNGCYGRGWTTDGRCVEREGGVGAYLITPMLKAYEFYNDKKYLESAQRAYIYYISSFKKNGFSTDGTLDTRCIDRESAYPLLTAAIALYKITKDDAYLNDAVDVSYYLSTWLWHYNINYAIGDAFQLYGYKTLGATSVSTQRHYFDTFACRWVNDWRELAKLTDDSQWSEKAEAIWRNCCQLVGDGILKVNGHTLPIGSQNDAYYGSAWFSRAQNEGVPPVMLKNRFSDRLIAWPCAFRMETLRKKAE